MVQSKPGTGTWCSKGRHHGCGHPGDVPLTGPSIDVLEHPSIGEWWGTDLQLVWERFVRCTDGKWSAVGLLARTRPDDPLFFVIQRSIPLRSRSQKNEQYWDDVNRSFRDPELTQEAPQNRIGLGTQGKFLLTCSPIRPEGTGNWSSTAHRGGTPTTDGGLDVKS